MKAIVVHQPYASLIASGRKPVELRSRKTSHRGPLAIIAGKTVDEAACLRYGLNPASLPICCQVAVVDLASIGPVTPQTVQAACVSSAAAYNARHAWHLANPRPTAPRYVRGMPGLFEI